MLNNNKSAQAEEIPKRENGETFFLLANRHQSSPSYLLALKSKIKTVQE